MYHRYVSTGVSPYTGERYGVFVAVWHLVRDGKVSEAEATAYWEHRAWFEQKLPVPGFYSQGNPERAVTWFRDDGLSAEMATRLEFYLKLGAKYGVEIEKISTAEPGTLVYEDKFQVAAKGRLAAG